MDSKPENIEEFDNLEDEGSSKEAMEDIEVADSVVSVEEGDQVDQAAGEAEDLEVMGEGVGSAPEMMFSKEQQAEDEEEVLVKYCLFCREIIPAEAIACKHCGHVVYIFEGKVFKQLYWFLWGGIISFVGCFLPFWSGVADATVTACTTFAGALYLVFTLLLLAAMGLSIYGKRLIISPVFLMFIPAVHSWWIIVDRVSLLPEDKNWYQCLYDVKTMSELASLTGSGLILIMLGSSLVALTFIVSLATAVAGGGKEKGAQRQTVRAGKGRRR